MTLVLALDPSPLAFARSDKPFTANKIRNKAAYPINFCTTRFSMDDLLEQPNASPNPIELDADDTNSSDDEDGRLDWTKLS